MKQYSHWFLIGLFACSLLGAATTSTLAAAKKEKPEKKKKSSSIARVPYIGAVVVDAATGNVLFEDNADAKAYPASVLKLMDLLIVLEKIKDGKIKPEDTITVSAEVSKIGGSQVYLKEGEVFSVEELLYALMIQSANDAAMALALNVAGSKEGFVDLMNQKAKALGMKSTEFHSIHGLPPAAGQQPDITTPRDLALLCREIITKYPEALRYTSMRERGFRNDTFIMRTHNHLLGTFEGCDGMKTGYFSMAGYSMAVTAKRGNGRVIAVILGSTNKKLRDQKAAELLSKGFLTLPPDTSTPPAAAPVPSAAPASPASAKGQAAKGPAINAAVPVAKTNAPATSTNGPAPQVQAPSTNALAPAKEKKSSKGFFRNWFH